jgi:4-hydroxy-3-methylbut-2-enyl diphosphate reductase
LSRFVDVILVIGSPNSSNSNRLRELGERCGIPSYLIDSYQDIQAQWLEGVQAIGIAAGASAPEVLVTQVIKFLKEQGADSVEELTVVEENVEFLLPKELLMAKAKR